MNRLLISLIWTGSLAAQETPAPPYVSPPAPGTTWTVQVSRLEVTPPPVPDETRPKLVVPVAVTVKLGLNRVAEGTITKSDGQRQQFYIAEGFAFVESGDGKFFALPAGELARDPMSLMVAAFPGVAWVSPECWKGIQSRNGAECFYYYYAGGPEGSPQPGLMMQAWVRKSDLQAVEMQITDELNYQLRNVSPFLQNVELPPGCRSELARCRAELKAIDALKIARQKQRSH